MKRLSIMMLCVTALATLQSFCASDSDKIALTQDEQKTVNRIKKHDSVFADTLATGFYPTIIKKIAEVKSEKRFAELFKEGLGRSIINELKAFPAAWNIIFKTQLGFSGIDLGNDYSPVSFVKLKNNLLGDLRKKLVEDSGFGRNRWVNQKLAGSEITPGQIWERLPEYPTLKYLLGLGAGKVPRYETAAISRDSKDVQSLRDLYKFMPQLNALVEQPSFATEEKKQERSYYLSSRAPKEEANKFGINTLEKLKELIERAKNIKPVQAKPENLQKLLDKLVNMEDTPEGAIMLLSSGRFPNIVRALSELSDEVSSYYSFSSDKKLGLKDVFKINSNYKNWLLKYPFVIEEHLKDDTKMNLKTEEAFKKAAGIRSRW